jgi:hypothetical protein
MAPDLREGPGLCFLRAGRRGGGCGSGRVADGLVVAAGVEGEVAEQFAGGGVDDADAEVLDEQQDAGSGVGPADPDVVELAAMAEGDGAGGADDVGADAVVGVGGAVAGDGPGPGVAGDGGGAAVWQRPVGALVVVVGGQGVELGLQFGDGGRGGLGGQPFLERLLEPLDLALGLRVVRLAVLLVDSEAAEFVLEVVAAAFAAGVPGGERPARPVPCAGR